MRIRNHQLFNNSFHWAAFVLFFVGGMNGQVAPDDHDEPVKVNTLLLNVPIIVSDREGRNLDGLIKENFSVYQGGEKLKIEFFANSEFPLNVAIIVDTSLSTQNVLGNIEHAAKEFISLLGPEDKGMIVSFDKGFRIRTGLTSEQKKLRGAINKIGAANQAGSNMNDALYDVVAREFSSVKGRKAVLVLTDGLVGGRVTHQELLDALAQSDVLVYPIIYQTAPMPPPRAKTVAFRELMMVDSLNHMNALALATGGRLYAADGSDFRASFQKIAAELKRQYVVGFYPINTESEASDIQIEVDRKDAVIRSKQIIRVKQPRPIDERTSPFKPKG
jgi:Ca-activated chloride channel family protein